MLGKLIKYEFRATARTLLPLYGTMVLLSILNRFSIALFTAQDFTFGNLLSGILMFAFVAIICATMFMTIFLMAQRFYRNLLGDEGYLMFTLPVPVWQNITGKLIVSVVWSVLSALVTFLSIFIITFEYDFFSKLGYYIHMAKEWLIQVGFPTNVHFTLYVLEAVLMTIVSIAGTVLMIYAALAIGHLFHRHRIMFAFGAVIGFSIVTQIISFLAILPFRNMDVDAFVRELGMTASMHLFLGGAIIVTLIFSAAYYLVTNYVLKNRLNLE